MSDVPLALRAPVFDCFSADADVRCRAYQLLAGHLDEQRPMGRAVERHAQGVVCRALGTTCLSRLHRDIADVSSTVRVAASQLFCRLMNLHAVNTAAARSSNLCGSLLAGVWVVAVGAQFRGRFSDAQSMKAYLVDATSRARESAVLPGQTAMWLVHASAIAAEEDYSDDFDADTAVRCRGWDQTNYMHLNTNLLTVSGMLPWRVLAAAASRYQNPSCSHCGLGSQWTRVTPLFCQTADVIVAADGARDPVECAIGFYDAGYYGAQLGDALAAAAAATAAAATAVAAERVVSDSGRPRRPVTAPLRHALPRIASDVGPTSTRRQSLRSSPVGMASATGTPFSVASMPMVCVRVDMWETCPAKFNDCSHVVTQGWP